MNKSNNNKSILNAKNYEEQVLTNYLFNDVPLNDNDKLIYKKLENDITFLMLAVIKGDALLIERCLNANMDVNAKTSNAITPLMLASYRGILENVKLLIEAGADVNMEDYKGMDSLICSTLDIPVFLTMEFKELFNLPEGWMRLLHEEIFKSVNKNKLLDRYKIMEYLLEKGANPKRVSFDRERLWPGTSLDYYIFNEYMNSLEIIDIMIQYGVSYHNPMDIYESLKKHTRLEKDLIGYILSSRGLNNVKQKALYLERKIQK